MNKHLTNMILAMLIQTICTIGMFVTNDSWLTTVFFVGWLGGAAVFWSSFGRFTATKR